MGSVEKQPGPKSFFQTYAKYAGFLPMGISYFVTIAVLFIFRAPAQRDLWINTYTIPSVLAGPFNFFLVEASRDAVDVSIKAMYRLVGLAAFLYVAAVIVCSFFFKAGVGLNTTAVAIITLGFAISYVEVPYTTGLWRNSRFWLAAFVQSTFYVTQLALVVFFARMPADRVAAISTFVGTVVITAVGLALARQANVRTGELPETDLKKPFVTIMRHFSNPGTLTLDRLVFDQMTIGSLKQSGLSIYFYVISRLVSAGFSALNAVLMPLSLSRQPGRASNELRGLKRLGAIGAMAALVQIFLSVAYFQLGMPLGTFVTATLSVAFAVSVALTALMTHFRSVLNRSKSKAYEYVLMIWGLDVAGRAVFYLNTKFVVYSLWTFVLSLTELALIIFALRSIARGHKHAEHKPEKNASLGILKADVKQSEENQA